MKTLIKSIAFLTLASAFSACGQQANEYVGNWQAKKYANRSVQIERNGDNYVIKATEPMLYGGGKTETSTIPAVYKDGMLEISNGFGTVKVSYIKDSDTLLMPTMGGSMEYRRAN